MTEIINYGLIGFSGKMGEEISKLFSEKGYICTFKKNSTIEELDNTRNIDVIIDFSSPNALADSIKYSKDFQSPLIVGTTGLTIAQIEQLKELSKKVPVVQAYNFSTGIQLLSKIVELTNSYIPDWDIEIVETHHNQKKDKPSGTALMLKEKLNNDVSISSLRIGGIPGDHKVIFGSFGEILELSHRVISKRTFAEGVLKATQFIKGKKCGFYSYSQVLFSGEALNEQS